MAKLTAEEEELMDRLSKKREAPDEPPVAKSLNISLDFGDEKQVGRAIRMGLLSDDTPVSTDSKDGKGKSEDDDKPKRPGYFKDN